MKNTIFISYDHSHKYENNDCFISTSWKLAFKNDPNLLFQESKIVHFNLNNTNFIYLSVVYYQDGDTFGTTHGLWTIEGVFDNIIDAQNKCSLIAKSKANSHPWNNYFAHLSSTDVVSLPLV